MPKRLCSLGMYCQKMTLPLYKTITSSTARCSEGLQNFENFSFRISNRFLIFHNLSEFSSVMSGSFLSVKCRKRRMWKYLSHFIALPQKLVWNWLVVAQQSVSLSLTMYHCIFNARNTSITASVTSGRGEGPSSILSRWSWYYLSVSTTSSVIISAKYNRKR